MLGFIEIAIPHGGLFLTLGIIFGFYMAWSIGANDVANAMGTSVGSGALTLRNAVIIAAIMELAGAVLVGSHVTDTVRKGIFDPTGIPADQLVAGFLGALFAAAAWLQLATFLGWPVSTTHSIVGAIVGVACVIGGPELVDWKAVLQLVASWVTSPVVGGAVAFFLYKFIHHRVLTSDRPIIAARTWTPFLVFYVGFVLSLVTLFKGLKNLKLELTPWESVAISVGIGLVFFAVAYKWVRGFLSGTDPDSIEDREEKMPIVESIFAKLMVLSACFLAFAHGANDVANAIGPLAAVVDIVRTGAVAVQAAVPLWILVLGGVGIVIGLATWGYKVIETVGSKITELTPSRGFAANIGAATTIVLASRLGFPISTTHTLVGAVLGIGFARGREHLDFKVLKGIVASWLITVPAGAVLAVVSYWVIRLFVGS